MKNLSLPREWLDYKPYGSVIHGTRILAFKVPLSMRICQKLPLHEQFTPELLMKAIPNLKYIIDLTNTNRYYDKTDFTDAGIEYYKIMINGGEVPKEVKVAEFCRVMNMIMSAVKDDEIIGVHCTHGINRTGYLICKYLIKICGWDRHHAIKAFEHSREHNIRRINYIQNLLDDSIRPSPPPPPPPRKTRSPLPRLSSSSLPQTNWRHEPRPAPHSRRFSSIYHHRSTIRHLSRSSAQHTNWRNHSPPPPPPYSSNSSRFNSNTRCDSFSTFQRKHNHYRRRRDDNINSTSRE